MRHFLQQNGTLIVAIAFLFGTCAYVWLHDDAWEKRERRKRLHLPQPGMIRAYVKILKQLFWHRLRPHHLPRIAVMIDQFKERYQYTTDEDGTPASEYHQTLLEQYRLKAEEIEPEAPYVVTPEGVIELSY